MPDCLGCSEAFKEDLEAFLEEMAPRNLFIRALAAERPLGRFFKQCSVRIIRWETMDLLLYHGGLLLGLRCNARDSRLHSEGLKGGGFELSGDNAECSVLAAFQLVQSGWGLPGLPGWAA